MSNIKNKRVNPKKILSGGDFSPKILATNRTSHTTAQGRHFSFQCTAVIGNGAGYFGIGIGKGKNTNVARQNAINASKKNIYSSDIVNGTIRHPVYGKSSSTKVIANPKQSGGINACDSVKTLLSLAGFKNMDVKIIKGGKNIINIVDAVVNAFSKIKNEKHKIYDN